MCTFKVPLFKGNGDSGIKITVWDIKSLKKKKSLELSLSKRGFALLPVWYSLKVQTPVSTVAEPERRMICVWWSPGKGASYLKVVGIQPDK